MSKLKNHTIIAIYLVINGDPGARIQLCIKQQKMGLLPQKYGGNFNIFNELARISGYSRHFLDLQGFVDS